MTLVVIDDDPTGAQTLRDIPLVFGVDDQLIRDHLRAGTAAICILTNSRAASATEAQHANRRVAEIVRDTGAADLPLVVSRGDSTLRGHLASETAALAATLFPKNEAKFIFTPAFVEAGRTTLAGMHYVAVNGVPVAAADTPYADDSRFGYTNSDLRRYLQEVGAISNSDDAAVISAVEVARGPDAVAAAIVACPVRWIVIDAVTSEHIDAIAAGINIVHASGIDVVVRCAPSLVRALAGQAPRPALTDLELREAFPDRRGHGLVVVGSHVPQATAQLQALRRSAGLTFFEVAMPTLFGKDPDARKTLVSAAVKALVQSDIVLATPRLEICDSSSERAIANMISDSLSDLVTEISASTPLAWLVAKGGITAHETAARGLGVRSADVVGQLFDSTVSIVRPTVAPSHIRGLPFVIFPGNVGGNDALAQAVARMRTFVADSGADSGRVLS